MCGIFCSILLKSNNSEIYKKSIDLLNNRGPNCNNTKIYNNCFCAGHVLWQQGHKPCIQPIINENNDFLLFNGDIFLKRENLNESDTEWIFELITNTKTENEFIELFKKIKGPFSLIYYNKNQNKIWFLRDSLGRNSLLIGSNENEIILSSVLNNKLNINNTIELPPLGIYSIDLNNLKNCILYPWQNIDNSEFYSNQLIQIEEIIKNKFIVNNAINPIWFKQILLNQENYYNFQEIIDNLLEFKLENLFEILLKNLNILNVCENLIELLTISVKERVETTPEYCKNCLESQESCDHPRVGILFSGGLDCTILAILADKFISKNIPIDLMNVAFEKGNNKLKDNEINWNVPDRLSAKSSYEELKIISPNRKWNLIEINIKRNELELKLEERISQLIYPLTTVLDESLGGALWFASRGTGLLNNLNYQSSCRVLLLGSGADELFGGYTRHRNAFLRENNIDSKVTLKSELELDWMRLPSRNLARDDRIICDHGITPRTPYLQEDFIDFVRNLEPLQKCYHKLEQGIGDKLLLRLVGYKLGLRECATLKKRALQFGSRIAISKQNAKDESKYLK